MKTALGHLTFCTNIFPGISWNAHFEALKKEIPFIKKQLAPHQPFGIGLRLSNEAGLQLAQPEMMQEFREWLHENDCYVFTVNGFPYGNFHRTRVKDQVHAPDWTTTERLEYTIHLFRILVTLLPEGMEGSISTSPLSYKYWFDKEGSGATEAMEKSTLNMVALVLLLVKTYRTTGKMLHIDIEPEADGLIENADEFIDWFLLELLPKGRTVLQETFSMSGEEAEKAVKDHVRLCYDVCHFAVGFEEVEEVLQKLDRAGIRVGKWQLSAALKLKLPEKNETKKSIIRELKRFDEPVYLHQVVAREEKGRLRRYRDLPDIFDDAEALRAAEWRSHFHVPLFVKEYGLLASTQEEVVKALQIQKARNIADYLEVETYTWDVLPGALKVPLGESIVREMKWVLNAV